MAGRDCRAGRPQHDGVGAVAVADHQDQVARLRALERGGEHEERLNRAGVPERRPEALLELALRVEPRGLGDRLRRARRRRRQDDRCQLARLDPHLREDALHRLGDDPAVAELRLEGTREGAREFLSPRPPRTDELIGDAVGRDHLGETRLAPEEQRGARVAEALLGGRVGLGDPAVTGRHEDA